MDKTSDPSASKKATRLWLIVCLVALVASLAMYKVYRQGLNDGASLAHQSSK